MVKATVNRVEQFVQNGLFQSLDRSVIREERLTDFNGIYAGARCARALSPKANRARYFPRTNGVRVNVNSVQFSKAFAGVGVQIFHCSQFLSFGVFLSPL